MNKRTRNDLPPENVLMLSLEEVAAMLCIGQSTVRKLSKDGDFPRGLKLGSATRWRMSDIRAWVDSLAPRWENKSN